MTGYQLYNFWSSTARESGYFTLTPLHVEAWDKIARYYSAEMQKLKDKLAYATKPVDCGIPMRVYQDVCERLEFFEKFVQDMDCTCVTHVYTLVDAKVTEDQQCQRCKILEKLCEKNKETATAKGI